MSAVNQLEQRRIDMRHPSSYVQVIWMIFFLSYFSFIFKHIPTIQAGEELSRTLDLLYKWIYYIRPIFISHGLLYLKTINTPHYYVRNIQLTDAI